MPYLNVTQVESAVESAAKPPNNAFTQLITLPNKTWEGRTCHAIKIAGATGADRPGVYFIGGVHAREWGSPDILINFIDELSKAYRTNKGIALGGTSFTAPQVQSIVNGLDIFVFPQVNPDGRSYSMNSEALWRKNRRPAPSAAPSCLGVDLNRNYDWMWDYPVYFHPSAPIVNSTNPCEIVYIGPNAVSEPETQNVVWMTENYPNIRFFMDVHSYGEWILYSWGDDQNQTTDPAMNFQNPAFDGQRGIKDDPYREYIASCDRDHLEDVATQMQAAISALRGRIYTVAQSALLLGFYPTAGTSEDYHFARHLVDKSNGKIRSYTLEWGSSTNETPFHPPYAEMKEIIDEVTAGLLQFCLSVLQTHADVYIRDNLGDTGAAPAVGVFWNSPDVIVKQNDDDVFAPQPARRGQTNYLYVRVTNRGPAASKAFTVGARAVRFPGTEFVYPYDWTTEDATHLKPTPILDSFTALPPGDTRVAKFSLTAAQVETLWDWQSNGWHPCLLADVDGCNDHGAPWGPHVWENNNLGQRNISIVEATASAMMAYQFVAGNPMNLSDQMELVVDRSELPRDVDLTLDPLAAGSVIPDLPVIPPDPADDARNQLTFLDLTRVNVRLHRLEGILTLMPGSTYRPERDPEDGVAAGRGAYVIRKDGRALVAVVGREGSLTLRKSPGELRPVRMQFQVPASATPGEVYRVHVSQRDGARRVVGGTTLEVHVVKGAAEH